MKFVIVYSSLSGNTKKLAQAIHDTLNHSIMMNVNEMNEEEVNAADVIAIGYWVDKGDCDTLSKQLLERIKDKNIILFGTLGAAENSAYYQMIKEHVERHTTNTIMGHFLCQGKVNDALIERYRKMLLDNPEDEHMKQQVANYENGRTHPDEADMKHVKEFVRCIVKGA